VFAKSFSAFLQGSEFSKELVQTLAERAELEANYARGLQKLSAKLFRCPFSISVE
jgi:hypothetical protein